MLAIVGFSVPKSENFGMGRAAEMKKCERVLISPCRSLGMLELVMMRRKTIEMEARISGVFSGLNRIPMDFGTGAEKRGIYQEAISPQPYSICKMTEKRELLQENIDWEIMAIYNNGKLWKEGGEQRISDNN